MCRESACPTIIEQWCPQNLGAGWRQATWEDLDQYSKSDADKNRLQELFKDLCATFHYALAYVTYRDKCCGSLAGSYWFLAYQQSSSIDWAFGRTDYVKFPDGD